MNTKTSTRPTSPANDPAPMALNIAGLTAARASLDPGAVLPRSREVAADEIIGLLNDSLPGRSHAAHDDSHDLKAMTTANLIAECVAIESYGRMISMIGDKDTSSRRLLEDILADEQEHAEELKGWLDA